MLASQLDAMSREGPEYISPSFGWINPTLDPYALSHTFRTPSYKVAFDVIKLFFWYW
jgi:hypothetical protein